MNPALKTKIIYQCNLNFTIIKKYLSFLINGGYLNVIDRKTRNHYATTQKGIDYMSKLNPVIN